MYHVPFCVVYCSENLVLFIKIGLGYGSPVCGGVGNGRWDACLIYLLIGTNFELTVSGEEWGECDKFLFCPLCELVFWGSQASFVSNLGPTYLADWFHCRLLLLMWMCCVSCLFLLLKWITCEFSGLIFI